MRFSKKAQAEVVGLLVIVILLLFVGVIFLRFYLIKPDTSYASSRSSLEAGNVLNALIQVHIKGIPFADSVDDCYSDPVACQSLEGELSALFTAILKPGQQYTFSVSSEGVDVVAVESQNGCATGIVSTYSFIESGVFYDARVRLC
jgi:hypothetical protein